MKILEKTNLEAWYRANQWSDQGVINHLKNMGLTGRGGACFSTGLKWEITKNAPSDEKFVICNADEGEPGTFKDKLILEKNPETLIEGILIAAFSVHAKQAYIYLRGEYFYLRGKLEKIISRLTSETKTDIKIDIIEGGGAYICGDETAIIASIENRRGYPHFKPPFPPQEGLFGKPTVINNVETLVNVPLVIIKEDWRDSLRLFSISGDVLKPGVHELEIGAKLGDIAKLCGAKDSKAVYFGASGGCIPYNPDFQVSHDHVCQEEAMLGACSLIFVGKKRSILDMSINLAQFFNHESCGKCTPCREGNVHVLKLLEKIKSGKASELDLRLLETLSTFIRDTSLCGLGQSCTSHILTALKFFPRDFNVK
jgi:NADH:ubiquinone oxidoreductase subunit F (NADH-binding)